MKAIKNLPVLLVLLCISTVANAQDFKSFDEEFEAFSKEANSKYEDFRAECNAQYAKFLAESWRKFKGLPPVEAPKEQQNLPESVLKSMQNPATADVVKSDGTDAGITFKGLIVDIKKFFRRRRVEPMVQKRDVQEKLEEEAKTKTDNNKLDDVAAELNKKAEKQVAKTEEKPKAKPEVKKPVTKVVEEKKPLAEKEQQKTVVKANEPAKRMKSFTFYGTPMRVEISDLDSKLNLASIEPQKVANAWTLCSMRQYTGMIQDCLELKDKYKLCDWAYLEMLKAFADSTFLPESNESTFLTAYIYCQSGYRIRLGQSDGRLLMLYGSEHTIYNQPRYMLDGLCYYILGGSKANSMYWIEACDKAINDREQSLSLFIPEIPGLLASESNKRVIESDIYPDMRMEVSVNENLIEFYNKYPTSEIGGNKMTRWAMYANTPLDDDVKKQIYPGLKSALDGLSEEEQVSRLLSLIQPRSYNKPETSLIYGMDNAMWGRDRAFFAEETLFYPFSDCEDHAILFSRLVRDLLNLKVVLVYYSSPASPPHLATAVRFSEPLTGENQDRLTMPDGDTFYICDPTNYIPKPGVTMKEMKNSRAQVILLDN